MELTALKMRAAAVAALMSPMMILGGCNPASQTASGGGGGGEQAKFAGFEEQIPKWKTDIVASDALCRSQEQDQRCVDFEVACKAERTITPDDQAKGITARVVTVITWNGFDAKFRHAQIGTRAAEFVKGASGWTRGDHAPVNMSSCADL